MQDMDKSKATVWAVSALCRAVADLLDAHFNPVTVRGEISGFSRAASGHCYFTLKDEGGQIRCAMFRRAAGLLDFAPRDGELVEVRGRLGVYEARGDLQLIVESMSRAGQGALFEQFLRIKAQLEAQGLFDAARKRPLPAQPRAIGVVTSPGAAAWHDVMTALQRRVPHIPVRMAPALVQGAGAAATLAQALQNLYAWTAEDHPSEPPIDVILLVRGGGSIEDLWAFNDPQLAQVIAQSPVPVVSGVGHETDFTIADFVADVRAPTPTAAAEMAATAREELLQAAQAWAHRLNLGVERQLDRQAQRLDTVATRLGRPQAALARQAQMLERWAHRLVAAPAAQATEARHRLERLADRLRHGLRAQTHQHQQRSEHLALRLAALDPQRVLERGYAWLSDESGHALTRSAAFSPGQKVQATLADGSVPLVVR
ncbi:MAG: Exodeoxyribonuclease 7 large subunit [Pseudomonadota bacterium]|jgi:exodeoxyribonuclease VII large subunit